MLQLVEANHLQISILIHMHTVGYGFSNASIAKAIMFNFQHITGKCDIPYLHMLQTVSNYLFQMLQLVEAIISISINSYASVKRQWMFNFNYFIFN